MKEGQLYYLSNPDRSSLSLISAGHGYLWLLKREGRLTNRFISVATGRAVYFFNAEVTPLEQTDETLVR
jgi:hypothetical protein